MAPVLVTVAFPYLIADITPVQPAQSDAAPSPPQVPSLPLAC
jgi:hypothetical protein